MVGGQETSRGAGGSGVPPVSGHWHTDPGGVTLSNDDDALLGVDDQRLMGALIKRFGGPHAALDQLSCVLQQGLSAEASPGTPATTEDTTGYCYLRLFDKVEHRDAMQMGAYPSVAALRRFSNGRSDPFGTRHVEVRINQGSSGCAAHVTYNSGAGGMRPVVALAALAKDCCVGLSSPAEPRHVVFPVSRVPLLSVPDDLPYNLPDEHRYPYAKYTGLQAFVTQLDYATAWDFIVNIGGTRDQTQPPSFWTRMISTPILLAAYFRLPALARESFQRIVVWIRDPMPGRPGGVQIVPPDWPASIPTPVHHTMSRYAGLADWVATLPEDTQEVCRMALFGIHEKFNPVWWGDYHKTVDVSIMYARISPAQRDSFNQSVDWIPDGSTGLASFGAMAGLVAPPSDGFCYLELFSEECRPRARRQLGANPWAAAVARELRVDPKCHHPGTFGIEVVGLGGTDALPYGQGHVYASPGGRRVIELLDELSGCLRVGATNAVNALLDLGGGQEDVKLQPTIFPTHPVGGGEGMVMTFSTYSLLGKDTNKYPPINFEILREPAFTMMLGMFESVNLMGAHFNVEVSTGSQNSVYCAITSPSASLTTDSDWLAQPVNDIVRGSDQGYVHSNFDLPAVHPFEREVRAGSVVGNAPPSFRFAFFGAANGIANIRGQFTVRVKGQSLMGHIRVGAARSSQSYLREVNRVAANFPRLVMGRTQAPGGAPHDEDEDSESDAAVRASPPRANASASRAVPK